MAGVSLGGLAGSFGSNAVPFSPQGFSLDGEASTLGFLQTLGILPPESGAPSAAEAALLQSALDAARIRTAEEDEELRRKRLGLL